MNTARLTCSTSFNRNEAALRPAAAAPKSHWLEKTLAVAAIATAALAVAPAVNAAPVNYDESVSGDLAETGALKNFNFDIGANTISGNQFLDGRNGSSKADFDQFKFVVPMGTQLVGISLTATLTEVIGQLTLPLYLDVFVDTLPQITVAAHEKVNVQDPANPIADSFKATLPLKAGNYLFFEGQIGSLYAGQAAFWDYTWTFDVAAVPEPGSVALVGAALAAMVAVRRRRTGAQQAAA